MRMRKKKNGETRLAACAELLFDKGEAQYTSPAKEIGMSADSPVFLEIGAGKGGFAIGMSERHRDAAYFAMERVSDCAMLAAERAKAEKTADNLRFIVNTADELTSIFAPETVDHIFLNFSDPWSKKGYAKRRLTHRRYLAVYFNLLKDGGKLTFKTDNVGLFDFSLEEVEAMGLTLDFVTRDLHASERAADNIKTEYETAFSAEGIKINMLEVTKPSGFMPEIARELTPSGRREAVLRHAKEDMADAD